MISVGVTTYNCIALTVSNEEKDGQLVDVRTIAITPTLARLIASQLISASDFLEPDKNDRTN